MANASQITSLTVVSQPFIRAQIKENIKVPLTCLCVGNSPETGEFPAQMDSNAENASIWWRHHDLEIIPLATGIVCMNTEISVRIISDTS